MSKPKLYLLAIFLSLVCTQLFATTIRPVNVDELTKSSEVVVRGTIQRVTSSWDSSQDNIITQVYIAPTESAKGQVAKPFVMEIPGGSVDGLTTFIVGAPEYKTSDDVILFLNRHVDAKGAEIFRPADLIQGSFHVNKDPATGKLNAISNATRSLVDVDSLRIVPGGNLGINPAALLDQVRRVR